jgi:hypothetical protein
MGAVTFKDVEPQQYDHIYYHDYHGWRATKTDCNEGFNAFVAESNEYLKAVSFFAAADSVNYTFKVYDSFQSGQLQNELLSQSGYIQYTGFYTIDITEPLLLNAGNDFYVYLNLSRGGQPFDRTSEVPVLLVGDSYLTIVNSTSNPNESFYWNGSQWMDMYYYEDPAFPGSAGSANLCIKALTMDEGNVPVELTSYTATNKGSKILLEWVTATETNNQQFEIYRRSNDDGEVAEWMLVGFKESNGTTTEPTYYIFEDDITGISASALEYRLKQIDYNGNFSYSEIITVSNLAPNGFILEQNFPNPFNPSTVIKYAVAQKQYVSIKVYDVIGNEIAVLVNEEKSTGSYEVVFNANHLSAGVYYYTMMTDNFVQTKKMILLK